jgi:hypothetical protein
LLLHKFARVVSFRGLAFHSNILLTPVSLPLSWNVVPKGGFETADVTFEAAASREALEEG